MKALSLTYLFAFECGAAVGRTGLRISQTTPSLPTSRAAKIVGAKSWETHGNRIAHKILVPARSLHPRRWRKSQQRHSRAIRGGRHPSIGPHPSRVPDSADRLQAGRAPHLEPDSAAAVLITRAVIRYEQSWLRSKCSTRQWSWDFHQLRQKPGLLGVAHPARPDDEDTRQVLVHRMRRSLDRGVNRAAQWPAVHSPTRSRYRRTADLNFLFGRGGFISAP